MLLGIDIGGTFTDGFYIDKQGSKTEVKVLSTPQDMFVGGFFNCLEEIARNINQNETEILRTVQRFTHGSTIATNTVIEGTGAKVGMITTKGHRDVLKAMLGGGKSAGRPIDDIYNFLLPRPEPIVPDDLIMEVSERIDHKGEVIVKLNRKESEKAVKALIRKGIDTLAICFLWSFLNPAHEHEVEKIARDIKPDLFVSCSADVVPMIGEYQRFTATALNCMVQSRSAMYVDELQSRLKAEYNYERQINIMCCNKGIRPWSELRHAPVFMMDSGPVGGLCAAEEITQFLKEPNVIAVDMGGTSFDLGIIVDGSSLMKDRSIAKQWEYAISRSDIESIGAGGGSIIWYDDEMKTIKVGPRSAGGRPGPVCYGLGGIEPTISDADLVLGYLNQEIEIAGKKLDSERALKALGKLGKRIGKNPEEMAVGAFNLVNELMAGRVRSEMIGRGLDYRQFLLMCYGGAGPIHMTEVARLIGINRCIVPANASVFSAYGLCSADFRIEGIKEVNFTEPWEVEEINATFTALEEEATRSVRAAAGGQTKISIQRKLAMQFKGQFYQLEVPVPTKDLNEEDLVEIRERFIKTYNSRYGEASHIPAAIINILCAKVGCIGQTKKLAFAPQVKQAGIPVKAHLAPRRIYDKESDGFVKAQVYNGEDIVSGSEIQGPALINFHHTTIRLGKGERAVVDANRNFYIEIRG
jgi:N-methylhydantoinase A